MVEVVVIVPLKDNAGASLARERGQIEHELLALAGGYTRERVSGVWVDAGKVYRDESYRYTVATGDSEDILRAAPDWAALLRQEALFVSVRKADVRFIEPVRVAARGAA